MLVKLTIIIAGFVIVIALSEVVIRNAIELADKFQVSDSFVGLTILSIGTSVPEIITHVVGSVSILRQPAQIDTISALLIGTNVGSDIFQQNFILPMVGLLGTVLVTRRDLSAVVIPMIGASVLVWVFSLGGLLTRVDGAILVLAYVGYLIYLAKSNHLIHNLNEYGKTGKRHSLANLGLIILSFGIMVVVTNRVVHAAVTLADLLPVSASFLGVILLGVAAALPELTTSLMSLSKGRGEISAGILIGSNITNPLFGIGIGAVISTYTVPDVVAFYDLPIKIGTAIMIYIFLRRHEDLNRREAVTLIGLFFVYILVRQLLYPEDSITIT